MNICMPAHPLLMHDNIVKFVKRAYVVPRSWSNVSGCPSFPGYILTNANNGAIFRMSFLGAHSGWTKCEKTDEGEEKDTERGK